MHVFLKQIAPVGLLHVSMETVTHVTWTILLEVG